MLRKMHLWDFSSDIFSTPTFKNRGGCFQHFYVLIIVQIKISACHHFKVKSFNEMCYLCKWVRFWVLRNPFFLQYLSSLPGVWLIAWLRFWFFPKSEQVERKFWFFFEMEECRGDKNCLTHITWLVHTSFLPSKWNL